MKTYYDYIMESDPETFWGSVGAGILPICTSTGRILVAHRSPYVQEPNTWGVWGGKLDLEDDYYDAGEETEDDVEEAARREFREESEYNGHLTMIPSYIFRAKSGNFTYYNFIGLLDEEFEPRLDWETQNYRWMTFDEMTALGGKLHFGLAELIKNDSQTIRKYSN